MELSHVKYQVKHLLHFNFLLECEIRNTGLDITIYFLVLIPDELLWFAFSYF